MLATDEKASHRSSGEERGRPGEVREMNDDEGLPSAAAVGPGFTRRAVVLEPGASRPSCDEDWHDALVIVERGEVDLECTAGGRRRFGAGAVLWLTGIRLAALHNVGAEPVVLIAVTRCRAGPELGGAIGPAEGAT
jgi:hypothetical protein